MVIRKLKNKTCVCIHIYSETNWIGHILSRKRPLKRVIEGKIEVTE